MREYEKTLSHIVTELYIHAFILKNIILERWPEMLIFIIYLSTCYLTKKNVCTIYICHVAEGIFLS